MTCAIKKTIKEIKKLGRVQIIHHLWQGRSWVPAWTRNINSTWLPLEIFWEPKHQIFENRQQAQLGTVNGIEWRETSCVSVYLSSGPAQWQLLPLSNDHRLAFSSGLHTWYVNFTYILAEVASCTDYQVGSHKGTATRTKDWFKSRPILTVDRQQRGFWSAEI